MMTNKQLFNLLRRNRKVWDVDYDYIRANVNDNEFCPLTYAAYKKTGEEIPLTYPGKAARALGISFQRQRAIVAAADNNCNTRSQKRLRKQLLNALKLKEKENV